MDTGGKKNNGKETRYFGKKILSNSIKKCNLSSFRRTTQQNIQEEESKEKIRTNFKLGKKEPEIN